MNLSIPSGYGQVAISVIMFLAMPHLPIYLVSYIYPKPWYWLIPGAIDQYWIMDRLSLDMIEPEYSWWLMQIA